MSKRTTKTSKNERASERTYVHTPRVASFNVKKEKGVRVFTPVNKRAQKLARKVGKRTRVSVAELKQFKDYHKLRQYAGADGKTLVAIKF